MNTQPMAELLRSVLDGQIEAGDHDVLSRERLWQSVTSGPALTPREYGMLLLSPVMRMDYQAIKHESREETKSHLKEQKVETLLLPLAAADNAETQVLRGAGFTVTLYKQDGLAMPCVILVQLGNAYQKAIQPMTTLRLADTGGLEWLRGNADDNGEFTGAWHDADVDLLERVRKYSLILEPI